MVEFNNPVISGFNPDPSVCRAGEDYYLAASSFHFFPGVPLYHSRNLVEWDLIGHCLARPSQLDLRECRPSGGIFAPTLRYHAGRFYMITTNFARGWNFLVYADDIMGPWSDPVWLGEDLAGIDPDLFFDDDGTAYVSFISFAGGAIAQFAVEPESGRRLSEPVVISRGCGGAYPEAPHIYKEKGWYYLLMAEGGTSYGHMVTLQRSRNISGPFEFCPGNPVLSHRDQPGPIQAVGHTDLVQDHGGSWWLLCLGIRPVNERANLHNLGREVFLVPVRWTADEWLEAGQPGRFGRTGLSENGTLPAPLADGYPDTCKREYTFSDGGDALSPHWTYIRNPEAERYIYDAETDRLIINGSPTSLSEPGKSPAFAGIRQKEFDTETIVEVEINSQHTDVPEYCAGLTAYVDESHHYELYLRKNEAGAEVCVSRRIHDLEAVEFRAIIPVDARLRLRIKSSREAYTFEYSIDGKNYNPAGSGSVTGLCAEGINPGSYTGVFIGVYAVGCTAGFSCFSSLSNSGCCK